MTVALLETDEVVSTLVKLEIIEPETTSVVVGNTVKLDASVIVIMPELLEV